MQVGFGFSSRSPMRRTIPIFMRALAGSFFLTTALVLARGVHAAEGPPPQVVEVHTAAPSVITVVVQTGPHLEPGAVNPLDLTLTKWTVDAQPVVAIHRYSIPHDELKKERDGFPVTVRHRVFLKLKESLREGKTYQIATPYGAQSLTFSSRKTFCESIKVNQVGYSKRATSRFANFGVYLGDGGSLTFDPLPKYEVIQEKTGAVVTSGQAVYIKDDTTLAKGTITSGEHVYRLRLDDVPEGGPYFVSLPGSGRSRSFGVGDEYSREIAYVATRGLYHQRCGIALERPYTEFTRGICHTHVADTRTPWVSNGFVKVPAGATTEPIRGGYHDAGDFDRRPYHTLVPLLMLAYFEAFPTHFIDGQYNIPESGNGIPDFLDEALWGLLIWEQLQIVDPKDPLHGGVRAGDEMERHPEYGVHSAANDKAPYGTWGVLEEHTAICAGLFAQASRLVRPFNAKRADSLWQRAQQAWDYLKKTAKVDAPKGCFLYAALERYLTSGDASDHELFKATATALVVKGGAWPEQYLPGNTSAAVQTAHFVGYLLPHNRDVDDDLVMVLKNQILRYADKGTYMGPEPENEPYPQGVTRFMGFGAATAQGRYADVYAFASLLTADAAKKQRYINAVSQYADYALGLNPLGLSYYTGLGVDQPISPLQLDSYYTKYGLSDGITKEHLGKPIGNVPGILVYGPTEGRSGAAYQMAVSDKLYPAWDNLPAQRRYAQGWSLINGNEFTVWETMAWNVTMHGFLFDASSAKSALPHRNAPPPNSIKKKTSPVTERPKPTK